MAGEKPDSVIAMVTSIIQKNNHLKPYDLQWLYCISGVSYIQKRDYEKGRLYLHKADLYARQLNDSGRKQAILPIMNGMAASYQYEGKYDSAAMYLYQAIDTVLTIPVQEVKTTLVVLYCNVLDVWQQLDRDGESSQFYIKTVKTLEQKAGSDSGMLALVAHVKANYYRDNHLYDSAHIYYQRALAFAKATQKELLPFESLLLNGLAILCIQEGNLKEAAKLATQAVNLSRLNGDLNGQASAGMTLGEAYFKAKNYVAAIAIFEKSFALTGNPGSIIANDSSRYFLSQAYLATGNLKKALYHQQLYFEARDSMLQKNKIAAINQLEVKSQLTRKNAEIATQQLELDATRSQAKVRMILMVAILVVALLAILISILVQRSNRRKIQALRHKMEINRLNATIDGEERERARLARDIHDGIGGLLGAARMSLGLLGRKHGWLLTDDNFTGGVQLVDDAATELRKTAHNMMPAVLLESGLGQAVQQFCNQVINGYSINLHTEIIGPEKRLAAGFELGVFRIVQELVHNILKHAHATNAFVQLAFRPGGLDVTVEDDGIGIKPDMNNHNKGMGLKSIRERASAINGTCEINSHHGKGTSVFLEFNLPTHGNNDHENKSSDS